MIPVKIQCGCGQKYAFDVEPLNGRMPSVVSCPVCGADGTAVANEVIAQSLPAQPKVIARARTVTTTTIEQPAAPSSSTQTAPQRRTTLLPGQVTPEQAKHEARAKILWGDAPEKVTAFLMMQGYPREEAADTVKQLFHERVVTMRANGMKKIIVGSGLVCVPVITLIVLLSMGILFTQLLALTIMIGLAGLWMIFKGLFMVLTPKSEGGNVSEQ